MIPVRVLSVHRVAPLVLLTLLTVGCSQRAPAPRPWTLQELQITVRDSSRVVSFTNKAAGFFVTESSAPSFDPWHGWHIMSHRFMADYVVRLDGVPLDRSTIVSAEVRPDFLRRTYANGTVETIAMLDTIDAFVLTLDPGSQAKVSVEPRLNPGSDVVSESRPGLLLLLDGRHRERNEREDYPVWLGVATTSAIGSASPENRQLSADVSGGTVTFLLMAGDTPEQIQGLLADLQRSLQRRLEQRRARLEEVLNASLFRSSNERFDRALAWAKLWLDALIMRQGKTGIFAGLPWFSNYWGRDSFISLPGATLVTGNTAAARDILRSFASWQQTDPESPDEGRIPNLVTPTSISYRHADGTPWFVLGVFDYVKYSGDTAFVREIFPVVRLAVEGTLRHHTDVDHFLVHGDAETWMDAVGPEGPWSPRGNRANEIQALWYRQLMVSTAMAEMIGERNLAEKWNGIAQSLLRNFQASFIDAQKGLIVDHLKADGSRDMSLRPNQILSLDVVADPNMRATIFRNVSRSIVYPFGVGSLAPEDPLFHPYHMHPNYYPKDAAYHNGVVWTWLAGPWIKSAVEFGRPDLAFQLTEALVHQILDQDAVGGISELVDAAPRPGESEPRRSGTFNQTWSLAEFVRVAYQNYLGVSVDAQNRQLWLLPQLPTALKTVSFDIGLAESRIRISYAGDASAGKVFVSSLVQESPVQVLVGWPLAGRRGRSASFVLQPRQRVEIRLAEHSSTATSENPSGIMVESELQSLTEFPELAGLALSTPRVLPGTPSLKTPSYLQLTINDVQRRPVSPQVLIDVSDTQGDDRGPGTFTYPQLSLIREGSFDLTRFQVFSDTATLRFVLTFRALSDPNWHPEYGSQLTYAAIAIDADGSRGTGQALIGRNAQALMPDGRGFERIIFVGGGLRIEDSRGANLAEYPPIATDASDPIGNAAAGTIAFSLPRSLLGTIGPRTRWTVFVGSQDDYGGAGLGNFRNVERISSAWRGGGRRLTSDPNVYDILNIDSTSKPR
ncbi:MAG: hypothetical protein MUE68_12005 [Bacteroidetes bacterium]|jgi:glycogen debranching enzyme|nr:hypothetical protein [Bacteroidota bacterium]